MMGKIASFIVLMLCVPTCFLSAQRDSLGGIKYTPDFNFNEGLFLNFEQVKYNNPVPKSRLVYSVAYDDPDFYEKLMGNKKIYFFNDLGVKEEITTKNIWGYSRNGVLYIGINDGYYRITIVGSICHFVANLTTYNPNYGNPYSYPYYGYYNYYNPYGMAPSTYASSEMHQYLLDFNTGRILDYNVESIEVLLMADPELHDEFARLSHKKQKQLKFLYIRKFNEKHPLYFPKN
jgi:hypothetical protein